MANAQAPLAIDRARHDPLFIPVVLGSIRTGRLSYHPARLITERLAAAGHDSMLLDLRELKLPLYDEADTGEQHPGVQTYQATLARADALVWFTPEYNHGYTSAIKNAVQHSPDLGRRPAAVCGLSSGAFGGARAVEQLKLVLLEFQVPIPQSVYFSDAETIFDSSGRLLRTEFIHRIDDMLAELAWYARALAWGRSH